MRQSSKPLARWTRHLKRAGRDCKSSHQSSQSRSGSGSTLVAAIRRYSHVNASRSNFLYGGFCRISVQTASCAHARSCLRYLSLSILRRDSCSRRPNKEHMAARETCWSSITPSPRVERYREKMVQEKALRSPTPRGGQAPAPNRSLRIEHCPMPAWGDSLAAKKS